MSEAEKAFQLDEDTSCVCDKFFFNDCTPCMFLHCTPSDENRWSYSMLFMIDYLAFMLRILKIK